MKKKMFYSHLVETTFISLDIGDMELTKEERLHLLSLVDSNVHNSVLDTVLSNLESEDKKIFLSNLHLNDHKKIWQHLREKIDDVEEKIIEKIEDLKKELQKDIDEAKTISS
jgi:Mg/Co/Ni transporter MgtE